MNISACAAALLLFIVAAPANGQASGKKTGSKKESEEVRVKAWLNKGETKVLNGYLRSTLVNRPDNIEISLTPKGFRMHREPGIELEGRSLFVKRFREEK